MISARLSQGNLLASFPDHASDRYPNRFFADHLVDSAVVVTKIAQHVACVLANSGRRPADCGLVDFELRRGLRLPHPSDHRLIELSNNVARDDLFVMDNLAAAQ